MKRKDVFYAIVTPPEILDVSGDKDSGGIELVCRICGLTHRYYTNEDEEMRVQTY